MPQHDLIVIGAGPGGYVAAIRAAQLGLNVGIIEREPQLGGTCLRIGCIPSKALLESSEKYWEAGHDLARHGVKAENVAFDLAAMLKRKDDLVRGLTGGIDALLKKNKVTRYLGHGRLLGPGRVLVEEGTEARRDGGTEGKSGAPRLAAAPFEVEAKHIILATGCKAAGLPGVELDYERIGTSTEALSYTEVPKQLIVIGAGYIGLELGCVWKRLGAKVTVLEYLPRILPGMDAELAEAALRAFKKQGLDFHVGARVTAGRVNRKECIVEVAGHEPFRGDRVLVAVGRVPNTDHLGLDAVGIAPDAKGRIPVNERFETAAPGVYAIGDVIAGPMLAHKAEEEGVACAEGLAGRPVHVDYAAIPGVVYTQPEIAAVGQTEDDLKQAGRAYRKGVFHFRANARARALEQIEGFVKVLADAQTDRVLGVHIIGPRAGDLIAEAAAAMSFGASSEDLARCCHAHPTLAEVLKEAALAVDGRAIHA